MSELGEEEGAGHYGELFQRLPGLLLHSHCCYDPPPPPPAGHNNAIMAVTQRNTRPACQPASGSASGPGAWLTFLFLLDAAVVDPPHPHTSIRNALWRCAPPPGGCSLVAPCPDGDIRQSSAEAFASEGDALNSPSDSRS